MYNNDVLIPNESDNNFDKHWPKVKQEIKVDPYFSLNKSFGILSLPIVRTKDSNKDSN